MYIWSVSRSVTRVLILVLSSIELDYLECQITSSVIFSRWRTTTLISVSKNVDLFNFSVREV